MLWDISLGHCLVLHLPKTFALNFSRSIQELVYESYLVFKDTGDHLGQISAGMNGDTWRSRYGSKFQ